MKKRITRDDMFIRIAHVVAERGTCPRAKVGAVLVDQHNRVRSIGYNGSPPKEPHCEDVGCDIRDNHCIRSIHAEVNALRHANFLSGIYDTGYTLYVTHKPCERCIEHIVRQGGRINRVVYDIPYRYKGPEDFTIGGVIFERYKEPEVPTV